MSAKIWICIDHYSPRFSGFDDFDNDQDFLDYLIVHYPDDFPKIVYELYRDGVFPESKGIESSVCFYRLDLDRNHWDHFQRRYDYNEGLLF